MKKYIVMSLLAAITAYGDCDGENGTIEGPDNPPRLCASEITSFERVCNSEDPTDCKWRLFVKADRFADFLIVYQAPKLHGTWVFFTNPVLAVANVRPGEEYGFVVPQFMVDRMDTMFIRAVTVNADEGF
jgi:hypothetical protein